MTPDTATGDARSHHGPVSDRSMPYTLSTLLVGLDRLTPPFVAALEADGTRTFASDDDGEALAVARRYRPGLIIVGAAANRDLFGLIYDLRAVDPDAHILFLTPSSQPEPALRALASGADDVVTPPHSLAAVMLRAQILRTRGRATGRDGNPRGDRPARIVIDRLSRTVMDQDEPVNLTGREFELLERLLEARGRVVPRDTILTDIWGAEQDNEAVLDATVHRLRRKLENDPTRPKILTTVRGIGYRLEVNRIRVTDS